MAKKQHFCIIDTETTQNNKVADFAAVIVDRRGNIYHECAVLINGIFNNPKCPLFFDSSAPSSALWSKAGSDRRYSTYNEMLADGRRMLASVGAVNNWLNKAAIQYDPILTAYNLPFDTDKCGKTGILLDMFKASFCLWDASFSMLIKKRAFRQHILNTHAFNTPTALNNMTMKTDAETVARFVLGENLPPEPHTALEDIKGYEVPILQYIMAKARKRDDWLNPARYDWRAVQVRDWFKIK